MVGPAITGTFRILVLEEDPGLRELFKVLFEGYLAFLPETSRDAHRLLREIRYDLLVLDEDSGGLERRWGFFRQDLGPTLVIAPARAIDITAPDVPPRFVLPKPFSVEALLRFVEAIHARWAAS